MQRAHERIIIVRLALPLICFVSKLLLFLTSPPWGSHSPSVQSRGCQMWTEAGLAAYESPEGIQNVHQQRNGETNYNKPQHGILCSCQGEWGVCMCTDVKRCPSYIVFKNEWRSCLMGKMKATWSALFRTNTKPSRTHTKLLNSSSLWELAVFNSHYFCIAGNHLERVCITFVI